MNGTLDIKEMMETLALDLVNKKLLTNHISLAIGYDIDNLKDNKYQGEVPNTMEELQELSGVGYKTASVVLVEGFRIPAFPVDTHISRITKRIGLVKDSLNPTQISISLMKLYDKELYHKLHHQMIYLGRYTCKSIKPLCNECLMRDFCKYYVKVKV